MNFFKKLFNIIFSRAFFVALLIVLELVIVCLCVTRVIYYYFSLYIASQILSLIIMFYVINKNSEPEFKLSWLIIILCLPPIGAFIYLMFHSSRASRKSQEICYKVLRNFDKAILELPNYNSNDVEECLKSENAVAYGQYKYIKKVSESKLYNKTDITYCPMGEDMFEHLLVDLKTAEKFIFMEYFIIQPGLMWDSILDILKEKASKGVDVRVIYDDLGCIKTLPNDYCKQLEKFGIKAVKFNKLMPVISFVHNNRDHRKITVIDGQIGYIGGVNLADEYINAKVRFGKWKDTAFRFYGDAVLDLTSLFVSTWDTLYVGESDYIALLSNGVTSNKGDYVATFADGPEPLIKDKIGRCVYLNLINNATKYVYITTPYFIVDYQLLNAIKLAAARGVDVRIITPHIPDKKLVFLMTRSNYAELIESGCKVYEYTPGFIHAKTVVADDVYSVCGTINFDYRSLDHHFECASWVYGKATAKALYDDFVDMTKYCLKITPQMSKFNFIKRFIKNILNLFAPLM